MNFFYDQNPLTMKTFLLLAFLQLPTDSLPAREVLYQSIDRFYGQQTRAELLEYQESTRGDWLKYLPTLGITYTVEGAPRPMISYSTTVLYAAKKDGQRRAAKRQSIIETNRLAAERAKLQVGELLAEYELLLQELAVRRQIVAIDRQLFAIQAAQYEELEIAPSDFLKAKRTYLLQEQGLLEMEQRARLLAQKVLARSFWR